MIVPMLRVESNVYTESRIIMHCAHVINFSMSISNLF